jgi:hypothetical protein
LERAIQSTLMTYCYFFSSYREAQLSPPKFFGILQSLKFLHRLKRLFNLIASQKSFVIFKKVRG